MRDTGNKACQKLEIFIVMTDLILGFYYFNMFINNYQATFYGFVKYCFCVICIFHVIQKLVIVFNNYY